MTGKTSRDKGAARERELATLLSKALHDPSVARNLEQSRSGGYDLKGKALRHFAVEAKSAEAPRWSEWLKQARGQAGEGQVPVIAHRQNGGTWRFLVDLDLLDFAKLVRFTNALKR